MKFSHETRLQIDRLPSPSFLVFLTTVFFSTTHVGELATVRLQNVASIMLCIKLSFVDGGPYSVTMSLTPSTSNRNRKYLAPNKNKAKNEGEGGKWKWSVVFPLSFQTHVTSASHQTFFSYLMIPKKIGLVPMTSPSEKGKTFTSLGSFEIICREAYCLQKH